MTPFVCEYNTNNKDIRIIQDLATVLYSANSYPALANATENRQKTAGNLCAACMANTHRRRIKTEEKANVVAAVRGGGGKLIQFFATRMIKKRMNRITTLG